METIAVKIVICLLKKQLSLKNKTILITSVLDRLQTLPLRDIIVVSDVGSLVINGKELDIEEMKIIRESARALQDNRVFGLIQDQVLHQALAFGLNSAVNLEMLYTSKSAVWWGQEENRLLKLLAGDPDQSG